MAEENATETGKQTPPDRLSNNPRSPHFDMEVLQRGIGVRFKERERTDVEEYCISEGWIRMSVGRSRDRHGNPMTLKMSGKVEPYYQETPAGDAPTETDAE